MSRNIADRSVRDITDSLGGVRRYAGGLVAAGGVDGEAAQETGLAVDGEVEVAGDDQDALAGQAAVDADDIVAPPDVSGFVDGVDAGSDRPGDGLSWCGRRAGVPPFKWGLPVQGVVRAVLVVVGAPAVELVLQLGQGAGRWLQLGARLWWSGVIVRASRRFADGLGVSRSG